MPKKDEDDLQLVGTVMPQIEDTDPSKFVPIWKQEALDEKGRRRFHGAFTGGFSAGYFNTVGSKEGWAPASYVSSRSNRAAQVKLTKESFMDEEDKREFGLLNAISTTSHYESSYSSAEPGLSSYGYSIKKDSIGLKLLKRMGLKEEFHSNLVHEILLESRKLAASFRLPSAAPIESKSKGFGVGVFEEEDIDIYDDNDSSQFSKNISETKIPEIMDQLSSFSDILASFKKYSIKEIPAWFDGPDVPADYVPSKLVSKSGTDLRKNSLNFRSLNINDRGKILGEQPLGTGFIPFLEGENDPVVEVDDSPDSGYFLSVDTATMALSGFMPFEAEAEKHSRYIQYLQYYAELSISLPKFPEHYTPTQMLHEKDEFYKAAHIYRPVSDYIAQRFTSSTPQEDKVLEKGLKIFTPEEIQSRKLKKSEEQKLIVQYKRGEIERKVCSWNPSVLLCKRFKVHPPKTSSSTSMATTAASAAASTEAVPVKHIQQTAAYEKLEKDLSTSAEEMDKGLPSERPPTSLFKSIFGDDEEQESDETIMISDDAVSSAEAKEKPLGSAAKEESKEKILFSRPTTVTRQSSQQRSAAQLNILKKSSQLKKELTSEARAASSAKAVDAKRPKGARPVAADFLDEQE